MERIVFQDEYGHPYSLPCLTKLDEIFEIKDIKNNNSFDKNSVLSVSDEFGVVNQIRLQGRSFAGDDISKYKIVTSGDIIYTRSPLKEKPFGIIKVVENEEGIVSPLYIVNIPKNGYDPKYLYYCFDSPERTNNYLRTLVRKGAKNTMNISNEEWLSGKIVVSKNIVEQRKIGKLLSTLDSKIKLERSKIKKLEVIKKALLEKMFPKNGSNIPEIRFKKFTDIWEQRELVELCSFITKGATPTTYGFKWCESGVPFFRNDSIKDNYFIFGDFSYISEEAHTVLKRSEIKAGDVLIAITGDIGKVGIVPESIKKGNINQHIARVSINSCMDSYFIYQYLSSSTVQEKYKKIKTGLSMPQLSLEQIRKTVIKYPSLKEQVKIKRCLKSLDKLIILHRRKNEKLLDIKKAMLEKLIGGEQ